MTRPLLVGLALLLGAAPAPAQKLEPVRLTPAPLPEKLPWWGGKKKENQTNWSQLRGKVVVVHFWNCQETNAEGNLSHLLSWKEEFPKDLEVIGFHVPRQEDEWDAPRIEKRAAELARVGLTSVIDQNGETLEPWKVTGLPTLFLVDRKGVVRYRYDGLITWKRTDMTREVKAGLQQLLAEK